MSEMGAEARTVHSEAIIFDATCPLGNDERYLHHWVEGGCTALAPTVASNDDPGEAFAKVGRWLQRFDSNPQLLHLTRVTDFDRAKQEGRLGILLHFQNSLPLGRDVANVYAFAAAGVRMIQLTYNVKNYVGDGCDERTDAGLSDFGVKVIRAMNRAGIVVDLSHTGLRTTLDAMEVTEAPPVFSHSNVKRLCDSPRNLTDEQIKRVAALGGVIGANGFPAFVSKKERPTLDEFIDHMAYIADLVGTDHIGLGIDYYAGMATVAKPGEAETAYAQLIEAGTWKAGAYPPPPWHYPAGIELPSGLPRLTERLLARGFTAEDVRKILGGNFIRVFGTAWR